MKTKTKTEQILTVMQVVAWIAFIGYLVESGAILLSYGISLVNPEAAKNLYEGLDLSGLRQSNYFYYTSYVSLVAAISLLKSYVWYLVIKTLSRINLMNPFTLDVAQKLERISYVLLGTWVVGMLSSGYTKWLMKQTGEILMTKVSGEFVFMAGLVFIISQVFKRGVELQSENELTV